MFKRIVVSYQPWWFCGSMLVKSFPSLITAACEVQDANAGHQLAGGRSGWCPELDFRATHLAGDLDRLFLPPQPAGAKTHMRDISLPAPYSRGKKNQDPEPDLANALWIPTRG